MSTRLYPLYQRGNPQLRVLLPNFWMKLIPPKHKLPPNTVQFIVSPEMTRYDVKQYLEKIYKVPVVDVRIANRLGEFRRHEKGYIVKDDDIKYAFIALPKEMKFEFPDLLPAEKKQERDGDLKEMDQLKEQHKKDMARFPNRPGVPSWFN